MRRLRVSFAARQDLESIALYTEGRWGMQQRNRYLRDIENRIADVAAQPQVAAPRSEIRGGYRASWIGSHAIYFRVTADFIEIVRVLNVRMDPARHLPDA